MQVLNVLESKIEDSWPGHRTFSLAPWPASCCLQRRMPSRDTLSNGTMMVSSLNPRSTKRTGAFQPCAGRSLGFGDCREVTLVVSRVLFFWTCPLQPAQREGNGCTTLKDRVDGIPTFRFDAPDGPVQVWQHAFNLEDVCDQNGGTLRSARSSLVLYHYTNGLCFKNVGNVRLAPCLCGKFAASGEEPQSECEGRDRLFLSSHGDKLRGLLVCCLLACFCLFVFA